MGHNSAAIALNSVALGAASLADRASTVSIGSVGAERQMVNLARGTQDTDAVNVAQLRELSTGVTLNDTVLRGALGNTASALGAAPAFLRQASLPHRPTSSVEPPSETSAMPSPRRTQPIPASNDG